MRLPRKHAIAAAGAAAMVVLGVAALQASRDGAALRSARAGLAAFRDRADAGKVDEAAAALREAGAAAQPVLDGWWPAHAWSRTFGNDELRRLRADLDAAVETLARTIDARLVRIDALRTLRAEVDYASTLADLDAIDARRAGHGPLLAVDAPAAHAELLDALRARRTAFAEDALRNRSAVEDAVARLKDAGEDPRALLEVMDTVLPRPSRGDEADALAAVKAAAAQRRSAVLAARRIGDLEGRAAVAPTAREARAALSELGTDPDLARPADPALSARMASAQSAIGRRIAGLDAWEASVSDIDRALAAGEPDAAAVALGRIAPCDERTRAQADAVRRAFGPRALDAFAAGAIAAVDRGDIDALERRADALRMGAPAWNAMDEATRGKAAAARVAVEERIDRARYDELLRRPCAELAGRYLRGWPARVRRMAPAVLEWQASARGAPVRLTLESAVWSTLGTGSPARTLEDRPDAEVTLWGPGDAVARAHAADIRESGQTALGEAWLLLAGSPGGPASVRARVAIDLRDAVAADPVAVGQQSCTPDEWRAARVTELPVRDPLWNGRPHVLLLRATSPGVPALPPYPRR